MCVKFVEHILRGVIYGMYNVESKFFWCKCNARYSHADSLRTGHTEAPDTSDATTSPRHDESSIVIGAIRGTTSTSD